MAKNTEKKIVVTSDGTQYSAKWTTLAYRQYMERYATILEHAQNVDDQTGAGVQAISVSAEITNGMLLRSGMGQEQIDNLDAAEFCKCASNVRTWFEDTFKLLTDIDISTKNAGAVAEQTTA